METNITVSSISVNESGIKYTYKVDSENRYAIDSDANGTIDDVKVHVSGQEDSTPADAQAAKEQIQTYINDTKPLEMVLNGIKDKLISEVASNEWNAKVTHHNNSCQVSAEEMNSSNNTWMISNMRDYNPTNHVLDIGNFQFNGVNVYIDLTKGGTVKMPEVSRLLSSLETYFSPLVHNGSYCQTMPKMQ